MLGVLKNAARGAGTRLRERGAERRRLEAAFEADCRDLVMGWAEGLRDDGLAEVELDAENTPPEWITVTPTRPESAAVSISFDYPTFHVTLPDAGRPEGFDATAELFGSFKERLAEIEQRLDAIAAGRLRWRYRPSSGCVVVDWLGDNGEPFLETAYSGAQQGECEASGQTAPFAA